MENLDRETAIPGGGGIEGGGGGSPVEENCEKYILTCASFKGSKGLMEKGAGRFQWEFPKGTCGRRFLQND